MRPPALIHVHIDIEIGIEIDVKAVYMSSSVGAVPPPPGVVPNLQNPTDVLRTISLLTNGLVLGLTTLVTLGRFFVRFWITGAVFIEDCEITLLKSESESTTTMLMLISGFCIASWVWLPETLKNRLYL